jgi:hypothetical protein
VAAFVDDGLHRPVISVIGLYQASAYMKAARIPRSVLAAHTVFIKPRTLYIARGTPLFGGH